MINYHKHIKSGILCNWYSLLFNYQVYHLSFFDIIFTCYHFDTAINILTLTKKKDWITEKEKVVVPIRIWLGENGTCFFITFQLPD